MPINVYTDSYSFGTVNQVNHDVPVTFYGHWSATGVLFAPVYKFQYGVGTTTNNTFQRGPTGADYWEHSETFNSAVADQANNVFHFWTNDSSFGVITGSDIFYKSAAVTATASTPTSSLVTSNSATIACNYKPNTLSSTADVKLEYRKFGDTTWIQAGAVDTGKSGYSELSISRNLTGLLGSTVYEFRLNMTRTTVNEASLISAVSTFTTLAGAPTITTDPATNVSHNSAVLNSTLDINDGTGVNVYFKWGTDNPPTQNQTANQSASADGSFQQSINGLSANTTYFFQAFVSFSTPSGSPASGIVRSFTTPADPAVEAAQEAHVNRIEFRAWRNQSATIPLAVVSPASSSSDRLLTTASPFATGDVKFSKDGGAYANTTNLPVQVTASEPGRTLVLTAGELDATWYTSIIIKDQDGPVFRDLEIIVHTEERVGSVVYDASAASNKSAFKAIGQGTGHGIEAIGGATGNDIDGIIAEHFGRVSVAQAGGASTVTLDAGASASNDYYNGFLAIIVSGTGAGQVRVITAYNGTTKVATVDSSWTTNPASGSKVLLDGAERGWFTGPSAELASIPVATSSYGAHLQLVFQRFAYKITQTATTQTLFKADSSTTLGTRTVSDNGTTQTIGKLS